jgi:hypothetical protein
MKHAKRLTAPLLTLAAVVLLTPGTASAIPAFARKHNLTCSSCHSAMPYLNSTGRSFKEAGWRMPDEDGVVDPDAQPGSQEVSKGLWLDGVFPIAARIKSYAIDKTENSDTKIRPIHELEIFSAGNFWKTGSWFFELEGEDEDDFALVASGEFGWHPLTAANVKLGFGSIFHPDPYNSLQDGGSRLTVSHKVPLDVGKAFNARFRNDAQFFSLYGRTSDYGKPNSFFYSVGASAGNGNPEGENPKDFLFRGAYDFKPDIMVGGFYFGGEREINEQKVDLARFGFDFNLKFLDLYLLGLIVNAEEDGGGNVGKVNNIAGYLEGFYTVKKNDRPFFVPLVRYDWTEVNDGRDTFSAVTFQAGFYAVENAKVAFEYYVEVAQTPGKEKLYRATLLVDLAF